MTTRTGSAAEVDLPALLADRGEAVAVGVQRAPAGGTRPPRPPRRSPACGRRPRRACRSRARARRWSGAAGEHVLQLPRGAARRAQPVRCGRAHRPYPTKVPATTAQLEAITHAGGPLLILGGRRARARRGARRALRLARRAGRRPPDAILVLTVLARRRRRRCARGSRRGSAPGALRGAVGHDVPRRSARGCCARRRSRPASTRSSTPVTAADRLALLLERIDELPLASHDLRGNPSAVLGSIVQRIDRLKDELVTAADYAAWAATLPEDGEPARARAVREREFAAIYAAHDRHAGRGRDARRRRPRPARVPAPAREAARPRTARGALRATCSSTSSRTRTSPRTCCCGCSSAEHGNLTAAADDDQAITRFRGAATKNVADFRAEWPEARVVRLPRVVPLRQPDPRPRRARWWRRSGTGSRSGCERAGRRAARRGGVLALRERARAGAGGRRRRRAARGARRTSRRRTSACSCARSRARARRSPSRSRSARSRTGWRARPRSSSARRCATCWPGCGCSSTRATPAPSSARSRARRSSCARSTSRAAPRSPAGASSTWSRALGAATGVAADPARGARAHPRAS